MASVEVGGVPINLPRRSESTWEIWTKHSDDAFGPHFGLQHGTEMLYVSPTYNEVRALFDLCKSILETNDEPPKGEDRSI